MSSTSMCISEKLREIEQLFSKAGIPSPRLDTEVLLAHVLSVTRPYLHAHGEEKLGSEEVRKLESFIQRRLKREPIAYITGTKEFYGREFMVTPDVLIPRPETEELVELTLSKLEGIRMKEGESKQKGTDERGMQDSERATSFSDDSAFPAERDDTKSQMEPSESEEKEGGSEPTYKLLDVGCGSGCVGITLELERPELEVTLSDISPKALQVAQENAKELGAHVAFVESNLLSAFIADGQTFNYIVANLPYVDKSWETSPETAHEPGLALYADDNGLELIKQLIEQSTGVLDKRGLLLLEADPEQHQAIIAFAANYGFEHRETLGYALSLMKRSQE